MLDQQHNMLPNVPSNIICYIIGALIDIGHILQNIQGCHSSVSGRETPDFGDPLSVSNQLAAGRKPPTGVLHGEAVGKKP